MSCVQGDRMERKELLWLRHTAPGRDQERDREWDGHNRKQWLYVPVPVLV